MADINNVINVSLAKQGAAIGPDNMNRVLVMTSELGVLSSANRYATYTNIAALAADFPADSQAYQFGAVALGQSPNPVSGKGSVTIGYWRAVNEDVAATAGQLVGAQLSEATTIPAMQAISDGSFSFSIDGAPAVDITAVDFRTVASLDDIATVLDAAITGASVVADDQKLVITSGTAGATSAVTFFTPVSPATGTDIGTILALASGTGATEIAGAAATTLTAETKVDALDALKAVVNYKAVMFIDNPTDPETTAIATWAQANSTMVYDVFNSQANLERDVSNIVWQIKLAGQTNYRCLYSPSNQRKLAAAYMGRNHVVDFNGVNTALTMHLKELADINPEEYTQTEIDKAKLVGLDIYVTFKSSVPKLLTSGANDYTDNVYNIIAFIDEVQTDAFNVLGTTTTKIPQTKSGVNTLVNSAEQMCSKFVRANVFGPGAWTSPDLFGNEKVFKRAIETNGFYVLAGELSDQPTIDRENRISPTIQVAVKGTGAAHNGNYLINFNE